MSEGGVFSSSADEEIKKLVSLSKGGDEEAFGKVYDLISEPVYKFIYMRTRHRENAEDLLSLTFLKVWKNLPRYEERAGTKFTTWVFQICHNVIRDYYRSSREYILFEEYMENQQTEQTQEEYVDKSILLTRMRAALQHLSENHQNVLTLRFISGLSVAETARIMEKREGTVRVLQVRALKTLKKVFKP